MRRDILVNKLTEVREFYGPREEKANAKEWAN
jgi:hypothetical protein